VFSITQAERHGRGGALIPLECLCEPPCLSHMYMCARAREI